MEFRKRTFALALLGVTAIAVFAAAATQPTSTTETNPRPKDEVYFVPGEHIELPIESGPSVEEMKRFNEEADKSFERLQKENPDLNLKNLNH